MDASKVRPLWLVYTFVLGSFSINMSFSLMEILGIEKC